jgi:cell division protein FtsL
VRALAVVRSLPEHSLVDRLVRGRAWIPVIGVLLVGIVAMQVEVLKLGTNVGRLLQRTTALQSQNESLQASVASLGDDQRIEQLAAGMGMVMPAPTTITFLRAAPGRDPGRALANLHPPDAATFAGELAAQAAAATASTQASASPSSTTSTPTAPTSSSQPSGSAGG